MMSRNIEEKIVFGAGTDAKGVLTLIMGIPRAAYEFMKDGKTNSFSLEKHGIPCNVIVYGGKDHTECMNAIKGRMTESQAAYYDERHKEFPITDMVMTAKEYISHSDGLDPDAVMHIKNLIGALEKLTPPQ